MQAHWLFFLAVFGLGWLVPLSFTHTQEAAGLGAPVVGSEIERLSDDALAYAVADELRLLGDEFSGAVLVARRGKVIVSAANGLADRQLQIPNSTQTRFRVGSMDKMFTALVVLQLVQEGKINLGSPLAAYLSDYPNPAFAQTVTVEQLLLHTGGAGEIFGSEFDAHRDQLRSLDDYIALFGGRQPTFEPGSQWDYSNYGYILLGKLIEAVTGRSYYDAVQVRVFDPAGMTGSGFEPESFDVPDRARPYELEQGGYRLVDELPWRGTSAGGGYSTAEDMVRFVTAMYDGRLLDAHHREQLTEGRVGDGGGMLYGYGFATYPQTGIPMFGHGGGAPGMAGDLRILNAGEIAIVVLSNVAPPFRAGRLGKFISARVTLDPRPDGTELSVGVR